MSDWCILRTASRTTLRLAASLAKDGFEVWTPIEHRTISVPRMNAKTKGVFAMLPSYVFARARHLVDLLELAAMPVKPRRGPGLREPAHAGFHVVHWQDRIPLIADKHFTDLRRIEARRTPQAIAAYSLPQGSYARVHGGICGGMTGRVERSTPKTTVLRFRDGYPFEIPTCMVQIDEVSNYHSAALEAA